MATKKDERVRAQENMVLRDADRRAFLEAVSSRPVRRLGSCKLYSSMRGSSAERSTPRMRMTFTMRTWGSTPPAAHL